MQIQLTVWGSRSLIECIAENYYAPRVLNDEAFRESYGQLLPQPVVSSNHYIGTVCSVLPLVSNFFLVDDSYLKSPQTISPIPVGYDFDFILTSRAFESFDIEILPKLDVQSYDDFVIVVNATIKRQRSDEILEHLANSLECISEEHCFAWFMLAADDGNYFRQMLNIRRPENLTLPDCQSVERTSSDTEIFSYGEKVAVSPDDDSGREPLKSIIEKHGADVEFEDIKHRHYWPAKVTPEVFRSSVREFINDLYPYASCVEFEDVLVYSSVKDLHNESNCE